MKFLPSRITLLLAVAFVTPLHAQPSPTPPTGTLTQTFTDRSPLSAPAEIAKRLNDKTAGADYTLADEPFTLFVPPTYSREKPPGVLLLLNYKDTPAPPAQPVLDLLTARNLIFIAPVKSQHPWNQTASLALDAVHNLSRLYTLDPTRIYLFDCDRENAGARVALAYPDVFTAGYFNGLYAYRAVRLANSAMLPATFPPPRDLAKAKSNAFVLHNRDDTDPVQTDLLKRQQAAYKTDGFKHIKTLSVTIDQLHYPNWTTDWLEETLTFFDTYPRPTVRPATRSAKPTTAPTSPPPTK